MIIDLEPVFNNDGYSVPFDYNLDLSDLIHSGGNPLKTPVRLFGQVKNVTGIVTMDAKAEYVYDSQCDRCACDVKRQIIQPLHHCIINSSDGDDNDPEYITVTDMRLNVDSVASEDILLALPSKFLCREDCKGLCPSCGADLNTDQCNCKKPIDPRLEGLLQFLE